MSYSVGDVAKLSRVTVRTLHHYDDIRLLRPTARTTAGYRRYSDDDLARLQRVLCYRELGFGLDQIAAILDRKDVDPLDHLRQQRALLVERAERLQRMIAAVEKVMEARQMGINLDPTEMFEVFGESDPTRYADEVEQQWGTSAAYLESRRRTAEYTKDDWLRLKAEQEQIQARFVAVRSAGQPASSVEAMEVAEEHRQSVNRWFYDCDYPMHRGLGELYVTDPRFTATFDRVTPGLARYIRDAIHANADRRSAQDTG